MSAGSGIYHQEMLGVCEEGVQGFQFWLNLPAKDKMNPPEYLYIRQGEMQELKYGNSKVRVISGTYDGVKGPINKDNLGVTMLHITVEAGESFLLSRDDDKQGFIFVFEGQGKLSGQKLEPETGYALGAGKAEIEAKDGPLSFIYAQGQPLKEPVAWQGPIVMNTQSELRQAFVELNNGTFIK
jgi:redox-sensitive bicupin YhaK (pirin superfamily)